MIKVVMADDHTLLRDGLKRLLIDKDIDVLGEAGSGREAVRLCTTLKPDILLLDLEMPDMDGFEVVRSMMAAKSPVKIIVLTMHASEEYAYRLIKSGVSGFLAKDISAKELPEAIRKVMDGKIYVTPSVMENLASRLQQSSDDNPLSLLSEREIQVLAQLARGLTVIEIAEKIFLSPRTIETYRSRAMTKLNLRNISDITRFAIKHGLIENL